MIVILNGVNTVRGRLLSFPFQCRYYYTIHGLPVCVSRGRLSLPFQCR